MTDDGLADLTSRCLPPITNFMSNNYRKGEHPSWTRVGHIPEVIKIP
jgi:hypothetical protein